MHYARVVEDLQGVEVIADDFLIARFSNSDREVNNSLKRHEHAFLEASVQHEIHGSPICFSGVKA